MTDSAACTTRALVTAQPGYNGPYDILNCPACGDPAGLHLDRVTGALPQRACRDCGSHPPVAAIEAGLPRSVPAEEAGSVYGRPGVPVYALEGHCERCDQVVSWSFARVSGEVVIWTHVRTARGWESTSPCLDCSGTREFRADVGLIDHCVCDRQPGEGAHTHHSGAVPVPEKRGGRLRGWAVLRSAGRGPARVRG